MLGEVIAAASGVPYIDFVRRNLLEPLGMTQTDFVYRPELEAAAATGYQQRFSPLTPLYRLMLPKGIVGPNVGRFVSFHRFIVDGPPYGGLIGTAEDAARFLALHVRGGDGTILSPASVEAMQTIAATGRKLEVGLGWFRYRSAPKHPPRFLEHTGGGGAFFNMMRIYPDERLGAVVMGNASSYDREPLAAAALSGRGTLTSRCRLGRARRRCGGGSGEKLSHGEFVDKANAICADYNQRIDALGTPNTFDEIATFAQDARVIAEEDVGKFNDLNPPDEDHDNWRRTATRETR